MPPREPQSRIVVTPHSKVRRALRADRNKATASVSAACLGARIGHAVAAQMHVTIDQSWKNGLRRQILAGDRLSQAQADCPGPTSAILSPSTMT